MSTKNVTAEKKLSLQSETLNKLQSELTWLSTNERYQFYEPIGKAQEFIQIIGSGYCRVGIISAANGIGKTALVANVLANIVFDIKNKYFTGPLFKEWKYPKRARYITDPKLVEEIGPFHSEIQKWWPKNQYTAIKAGHNYYSQYKANDWVIDVMTYEQAVKEFEGATIPLIIFDEPPPQDIWNACIGRLRSGGMILVFMTPLTHAAWFFDQIAPRHTDSIVYATMEDACKVHGVNGHLEHANIQAMINEMPPDEIQARAYGKALYLSGVIYKQFDPKIHVLKEPRQAPANATIYQAVDPHSDKPFASIWGYPEPNGDFYIIDEWPNEDFYVMHNCQLTIQDYANIFRDKEQGMNVHKRIIDRHFADVRSAINKRTLREELRDDVGLDYYASYTAEQEIETGILRVRSYLQYDDQRPISSLNKPRLFINPHCRNVIKSFQRWARNPENGKVQETYKDYMDCVRYILMSNPEIELPIPRIEPKRMWG